MDYNLAVHRKKLIKMYDKEPKYLTTLQIAYGEKKIKFIFSFEWCTVTQTNNLMVATMSTFQQCYGSCQKQVFYLRRKFKLELCRCFTWKVYIFSFLFSTMSIKRESREEKKNLEKLKLQKILVNLWKHSLCTRHKPILRKNHLFSSEGKEQGPERSGCNCF